MMKDNPTHLLQSVNWPLDRFLHRRKREEDRTELDTTRATREKQLSSELFLNWSPTQSFVLDTISSTEWSTAAQSWTEFISPRWRELSHHLFSGFFSLWKEIQSTMVRDEQWVRRILDCQHRLWTLSRRGEGQKAQTSYEEETSNKQETKAKKSKTRTRRK